MRPNHSKKVKENTSMSLIKSMCPAQINRLVLGYLGSQGFTKAAKELCKSSPYLTIEDYAYVKDTHVKIINPDKTRSLLDIIREFTEIREIVDEFFEEEWNRYDPNDVPIELLRARTLKDKVLYACRKFGSPSTSSAQPSQRTVKRKRSTEIVYQSEYSTDLSDSSDSVKATDVQDLPGYRPKRRKVQLNPNFLLNYKNEQDVICIDESDNDDQREITLKSATNSDPTSSSVTQMTQSEVVQQLSDSILNNPDRIVMTINEAIKNNAADSEMRADNVVETIRKNIDLDEMLRDILDVGPMHSSPGTSKPTSDLEYEQIEPQIDGNRQLNTPVPKDANRSFRYELRSQRKSNTSANTPTELKQTTENSRKIEILSDNLINTPISTDTLQNLCNGSFAILPDSDEKTVSTTSNQLYQQPYLLSIKGDNGTVEYMLVGSLPIQFPGTTSTATISTGNNIADPTQSSQFDSQIIDLDSDDTPNSNEMQSNQVDEYTTVNVNNERYRVVVVDKAQVDREGNPPIEVNQQQDPKLNSEAERVDADAAKSTAMSFISLTQVNDPKNVTPKQLIRPNPSKSLSTPRHVRVLNFNTPNRHLAGIPESKNELLANTSKYFSETPHNRSIVSSLPSSAPPKVNSVTQSEKKSGESVIDLDAPEPFVPTNEDTVISADGETPKVRKTNRKGCVRTLSAHKELNPAENEKRLKRVAKTKKKICPDDGDSNEDDTNKKETTKTEPISKEDAALQWEQIKSARNNPLLFEQNLREQNSKKTATELSSGKKKRTRRKQVKRKTVTNTKPAVAKALNETINSVDLSMNSSIDPDNLNASINLEARMLEEMLKSAKKATPVKQDIVLKSAKKKTPIGKLQIKLMPSPKNKALKRLKSKRDLAATQVTKKSNEIEPVAGGSEIEKPVASGSGIEKPVENQIEAEKSTEPQPEVIMEPEPIKPNENTTDDLEVAQNLISMKEVILKQESERKKSQNTEIQSDSISMSHTVEVVKPKPNVETTPLDRIDPELLRSLNLTNSSYLNISSLLETPFKEGTLLLPKTPGFNTILPQMVTPMLRPSAHLLDDSIFKTGLFPTPNFPITPGLSIFTPFKDIFSPKSEEIVYGAANRPTDYSSSSSYYKPDESDGIDRQIQASVHSNRTNSGVYSADEINDDSKIDDSQNTLNSSTSSSSSNSSSGSESDSESDSSSSSDSESSQIMNKSEKETQPTEETNVKVSSPKVINEDSTQIIKSHLTTANEVNIAKNILLSVPQEPVKNEEAERIIVLEEKRRRTQELLREAEMKKHEKGKPKNVEQFKKYRAIAEAKRDQLRPPTKSTASPSKRKTTQPKKFQRNSQQIQSQVVINPSVAESEAKVQTERLITEAANDNAVIDASDVTTTQKPQANPMDDEESVEAITSHLNKSSEMTDIVVPVKNAGDSKKISPESLVEMLSAKQKRFDANRPKMKTEVIAALPMGRTTRSRAKIRPAQNIITKPPPIPTSSTANVDTKLADSSKEKSKDEKPMVPEKSENSVPKSTESSKDEKGVPSKVSSLDEMPTKYKFVTPAKERRSRQIRDIFGDCTDIETPIKSPSKTVNQPKENKRSLTPPPPPPQPAETKSEVVSESTKFEADSSNVKDEEDNDESEDDDSGDEDGYELCLSIDDNDKKRFISIRENASIKPKVTEQCLNIQTKNVHLDGMRIKLAASEEFELYTQNIDSVASEMNKESGRRSAKQSRCETGNETISSSEAIYGKPLHTSTPSPSKSVTAKFNIKHKSTGPMSPKSSKNQSKDDILSFMIDEVLGKLHPTTK
ncbi:uncharacterized protein LOC116344412 [Contarinia nasturtii]|uniref:uncharacterized protein LOC116344412 n=1 Tax=Contarinia nasturtii TaxID=265458 RepID=UPI0012D39496|nr:uncharacterized protein LOC116344412 [Contarinia nasturtii]